MAREQILIVDDTPISLKLTRFLLTGEGYDAVTAGDAEEALKALETIHPAMVLLDIQLPGMDGLELTRRIKQDERTRDIAVIALTALATPDDRSKALDAGCDGYISKPIDTRALGAQIRELLDRLTSERSGTAPPPPPAVVQAPPRRLPPEELENLRRRFVEEGLPAARKFMADLDGPFQAAETARAVHQWIGAAGLLGFTAISSLSRELETALADKPVDVAEVRDLLESLVHEFGSPTAGSGGGPA